MQPNPKVSSVVDDGVAATSYPLVIQADLIEPYVGPRSFVKEQRDFFFGRDDEADELVSLIVAHPAVLLYSQSGAGKTSLLNAKFIPRLEEVEHFNVLPPMRVQGQIPSDAKVGKDTNIFVLNALACCKSDFASVAAGMSFCEFVAGCEQKTNDYGEPATTVMIFDQFEELFTTYPGRWADRENFFIQIGEALQGNPKKGLRANPLLRVIFCMREDYIAELDPYLSFLPEKLRTRFRLEHLRKNKALTAITKPIQKTNRRYAPEVAEQLVENLRKIPSQSVTGTHTTGLYVEPVQLQVVCQSLWEALAPEETVITAKHLEKYGDVSQALSNFYERSISTVSSETGVKEETLRRWFADTLITPEGTRAPINRGQDSTGGMPNKAVDKLEAIRLIKGEWKGANVRWYELAHDRFIEPIRKSNESWLANQSRSEQVRLRLEAKASKWKPGSKTLEVDELLEAQQLVKARVASKTLQALVDASRASVQRKRVRFFKLVGVACGVAAVVFLLVALYAWKKGRDASLAERTAKSRLLAIKASMSLAADPELSVLLAKEAIDTYANTKEARDVIRSGLLSLSKVGGALRGHDTKVLGAEFSRDGKFVLTRTGDGKVRLWDAATKNVVKELNDKEGGSYATFSPDGKFIATAGTDGVVRVWDGTTGTFLKEFSGHADAITRVAFSPDSNYLASASYDHTARVWNVTTGQQEKVLEGHTAWIAGITFSSDGTHIATEAADETAKIWNLHTDKVVTLHGLTGSKSAIAFSPDGQLLATEGGPNTTEGKGPDGDFPATVWDVETGKVKLTLGGHNQDITGISFSPDGKLIVTSSDDGTARLWSREEETFTVLEGHTRSVTSALFSPDSALVLTASADNTARVWDSLDGTSVADLRGHSQGVNGAAFSSDGKFIVTASDDQTARLWPVQSHRSVFPDHPWTHSAAVTSVALNSKSLEVAATTRDGKLWLDDARVQLSLSFPKSPRIADARFSPDGRFMATTKGQVGMVYELHALRLLMGDIYYGRQSPTAKVAESIELNGHAGDVNSIAFSPDGTLVVTASTDTTARVWNARSGESIAVLRDHGRSVNSAVFSPDGKFIVTASDDGYVRKWDVAGAKMIWSVGSRFPSKPVSDAEYSPDGRLIVTTSGNAAKVCDAETGKERTKLEGHTAQVNSASFSPDSRLVITSSVDNTARVWDAQTGESIATLLDHKGAVLRAVFSPDGQSVLTASEDYMTRIYPQEAFMPYEQLRGLIEQRVARKLTAQERENYLKDTETVTGFSLEQNGRYIMRIFASLFLAAVLPACSTQPAAMQVDSVGNPDIKVWVDTRAGFYHCPNSNSYGTTGQGVYMTQRQAQDRRYRPATGYVCR